MSISKHALPLSYGASTEGKNGPGMYCDWCRRRPSDGAQLRFFSANTIVCERSECERAAVASWERMLEEQEQREAADLAWEAGELYGYY